jgi:hypothetical protein
MKQKIIGIATLGLLLLAGAAVYVYADPAPGAVTTIESPSQNDSQGSGSSTMPAGEGKVSPTSATLTGTIECLPHKGSGPSTMECAIGLKGDDGKHYALTMFDYPGQAGVGDRVALIGAMVTTDELHQQYDIVGTFQVDTATKL